MMVGWFYDDSYTHEKVFLMDLYLLQLRWSVFIVLVMGSGVASRHGSRSARNSRTLVSFDFRSCL